MMISEPIIALDFSTKSEIANFLAQFPSTESLFLKVGMEIFYQEGPEIIQWLQSLGHDIFLDLKLHDIPNTVERAMRGIAKLGVALTTVHAAGGVEMMMAAQRGLLSGTQTVHKKPLLIAVTQLTSTNEEQMQQEQLIPTSLLDSVLHYAQITQKAGLDGVVCSAFEAEAIHAHTSDDFICLTPSIRPRGADKGDQKRVVTPQEARIMGSNAIVVGRPITQAENPFQAYQAIKNEWNGIDDY
ncbi:MAG: orotidine-5'-phosphate decarboxylase [Micrococcaceae bacterium]